MNAHRKKIISSWFLVRGNFDCFRASVALYAIKINKIFQNSLIQIFPDEPQKILFFSKLNNKIRKKYFDQTNCLDYALMILFEVLNVIFVMLYSYFSLIKRIKDRRMNKRPNIRKVSGIKGFLIYSQKK